MGARNHQKIFSGFGKGHVKSLLAFAQSFRDKLQCESGLPRAGFAFHQVHMSRGIAAAQDVIQSGASGTRTHRFRFVVGELLSFHGGFESTWMRTVREAACYLARAARRSWQAGKPKHLPSSIMEKWPAASIRSLLYAVARSATNRARLPSVPLEFACIWPMASGLRCRDLRP